MERYGKGRALRGREGKRAILRRAIEVLKFRGRSCDWPRVGCRSRDLKQALVIREMNDNLPIHVFLCGELEQVHHAGNEV